MANDPTVGECRSCHAKILWCESINGKTMPLDFEPSPQGNVRLEGGVGYVMKKTDLFEPQAAGGLRLNHFATCPSREQHRKKK